MAENKEPELIKTHGQKISTPKGIDKNGSKIAPYLSIEVLFLSDDGRLVKERICCLERCGE